MEYFLKLKAVCFSLFCLIRQADIFQVDFFCISLRHLSFLLEHFPCFSVSVAIHFAAVSSHFMGRMELPFDRRSRSLKISSHTPQY